PRRRPTMSSFARSSSLAFATRASRLFRMPPRPRSSNSWLASMTVVANPAWAATWAMPEPISPQPSTPTRLMAVVIRRPSFVDDEGLERVSLQPIPPLEKRQLDQKRRAQDLAAQPLDEPERRRHGSTGGEKVVHDQHALARLDGVLMDGQDVAAVFELVLLLDRRRGQLPALPDRHEPGAQLMGQRAAEDEPPGFHANDHVHTGRAVLARQMVDDSGPGRPVLEQRGDVAKEDALGREVLDIADLGAKLEAVHDGVGFYHRAAARRHEKAGQRKRGSRFSRNARMASRG